MQTITAPPQFVRSLLEGAKLRGYDAGEILIAEGLPAQAQEYQRVRISTKQFAALTTRVIQMLDDEACGQLEGRVSHFPVRQRRKSSPTFKCTNKGTSVRIAQHKSNYFNTIPFLIDQINGHIPAGFLFQYLICDALLLQAAFETLRV